MNNMPIPAITPAQMAEVDRLMIEELGIDLIQMMENAGRSLAELSRRLLAGELRGRRIGVLCGAGNNGGGGMVAARHLQNWGASVAVIQAMEIKAEKRTVLQQLDILARMGIHVLHQHDLSGCDLILDALIGYGLQDAPREPAAEWIRRINGARCRVLSLDVPSGLDAARGIPGRPCVRANATMTLALPKTGLLAPQAQEFVGELYLADIGVPPQLYRRLGLPSINAFAQEMIVRL
jgi:NAD(P)H-hydrate epimerase